MRAEWIENIEDFRGISQKWDAAVGACAHGTPFLLADFVTTWWQHYGEGRDLRIFVAWDGDKIIGGFPLSLQKRGLKQWFRVLESIGGVSANYTQPFALSTSSEFISAFVRALGEKKDWDLIRLPEVQGSHFLMNDLTKLSKEFGLAVSSVSDHMNWAIDLSSGMTDFLKSRKKKFKKDLRSKRNQIVKLLGDLKLIRIQGQKALDGFFKLYVDFNSDTFQSRGGQSSADNKKYQSFLRDVLFQMDRTGRLRAYKLSAGGEDLAIYVGFGVRNEFNYILTSFNYKWKKYRPGYLLIEEILKELLLEGETYINMFGHETLYKKQWANRVDPLYRVKIFKKRLMTTCYDTMEEYLRSSPRLKSMAKRVLYR